MLEMKRPQNVEGFPVEDLFEQLMGTNQASPQHKQPRKIPVPVHHEPVPQQQQYRWQPQHQQMPMPQPTGFYPHQAPVPVPVTIEQEPQRPAQGVKNFVNIPVRHVPTVGPSYQHRQRPGMGLSPPMYRDMEREIPVKISDPPPVMRDIPITRHGASDEDHSRPITPRSPDAEGDWNRPAVRKDRAPFVRDIPITRQGPAASGGGSSPISPRSPAPDDAKQPGMRKQTSLIVSDDHTTPIPMPYEHLEGENPILEEDEDGHEEVETHPVEHKSRYPGQKKRTSLIVSDDRTTPIPMPYEQIEGEKPIAEEEEEEKKQEEEVAKPVKKHPFLRKQSSLVVSDDRSTPIPMPYEQLSPHSEAGEEEERNFEDEDHKGEGLGEEPDTGSSGHESQEDAGEASDAKGEYDESQPQSVDTTGPASPVPVTPEISSPTSKSGIIPIKVINAPSDVGQPAMPEPKSPSINVPIKVLSAATSPKSPIREEEDSSILRNFPNLSQAREIPITVQGAGGHTRAPRRNRVESPAQTMEQTPTVSQGPVRPGPSMPQPDPHKPTVNGPAPEAQDTYTQPRPPAPVPKPKWVDLRITSALETIQKITEEAESLGQQTDALQVTSKDRSYLMIEEQLTKLLLKLDGIESMGDDDLRSKRKACIKKVQQTLDALELKLIAS